MDVLIQESAMNQSNAAPGLSRLEISVRLAAIEILPIFAGLLYLVMG